MLCTRKGLIAGERNAAIHTMWDIERASGRIAPTPGTRKAPKLKDDFATQFRNLETTLERHYTALVALLGEFP